jgi:hypothetical protein
MSANEPANEPQVVPVRVAERRCTCAVAMPEPLSLPETVETGTESVVYRPSV